MNTSFTRKADFAYVYDLCALSGLRILIRLLRIQGILRTCTACALEATYVYEYVLACKSAFTSMSQ